MDPVPSPLELTEEQKAQRDMALIKAFEEEYQQLCTKHDIELKAVLSIGPLGITPTIVHSRKKPAQK